MTDLNGKRMQTGNSRAMIFAVATLASYCSRFITRRHHRNRNAAKRRRGA